MHQTNGLVILRLRNICSSPKNKTVQALELVVEKRKKKTNSPHKKYICITDIRLKIYLFCTQFSQVY